MVLAKSRISRAFPLEILSTSEHHLVPYAYSFFDLPRPAQSKLPFLSFFFFYFFYFVLHCIWRIANRLYRLIFLDWVRRKERRIVHASVQRLSVFLCFPLLFVLYFFRYYTERFCRKLREQLSRWSAVCLRVCCLYMLPLQYSDSRCLQNYVFIEFSSCFSQHTCVIPCKIQKVHTSSVHWCDHIQRNGDVDRTMMQLLACRLHRDNHVTLTTAFLVWSISTVVIRVTGPRATYAIPVVTRKFRGVTRGTVCCKEKKKTNSEIRNESSHKHMWVEKEKDMFLEKASRWKSRIDRSLRAVTALHTSVHTTARDNEMDKSRVKISLRVHWNFLGF